MRRTGIEWTEYTWNPWQGCHRVSAGCANCYMFREKEHYGQVPDVVVRSAPTTFNKPLKIDEPSRIFTCSWSDFFIGEADAWRDNAWDIIRRTPQHTYQILTKRTPLIGQHLPSDWGCGYPNVWLGVSVENQARADERIPELLKIPAVVRFISLEPLMGPVDLGPYLWHDEEASGLPVLALRKKIHWVIVGGESGPGARDMDPDWVRDIRDQCQAAGVPFFMKQMSKKVSIPTDLMIREFPPHHGGAEK